jgi:hypothetical protein
MRTVVAGRRDGGVPVPGEPERRDLAERA